MTFCLDIMLMSHRSLVISNLAFRPLNSVKHCACAMIRFRSIFIECVLWVTHRAGCCMQRSIHQEYSSIMKGKMSRKDDILIRGPLISISQGALTDWATRFFIRPLRWDSLLWIKWSQPKLILIKPLIVLFGKCVGLTINKLLLGGMIFLWNIFPWTVLRIRIFWLCNFLVPWIRIINKLAPLDPVSR